MFSNINCDQNSNIFFRVYNHMQLAGASNQRVHDQFNHEQSRLEWAGEKGLWFVRELPVHIVNTLRNPKFVTVALTVAALVLDSLLFYPEKTIDVISRVFSVIDLTACLPYIKFATYLVSILSILSFAARTYGRFGNEDLMNKFYGVK